MNQYELEPEEQDFTMRRELEKALEERDSLRNELEKVSKERDSMRRKLEKASPEERNHSGNPNPNNSLVGFSREIPLPSILMEPISKEFIKENSNTSTVISTKILYPVLKYIIFPKTKKSLRKQIVWRTVSMRILNYFISLILLVKYQDNRDMPVSLIYKDDIPPWWHVCNFFKHFDFKISKKKPEKAANQPSEFQRKLQKEYIAIHKSFFDCQMHCRNQEEEEDDEDNQSCEEEDDEQEDESSCEIEDDEQSREKEEVETVEIEKDLSCNSTENEKLVKLDCHLRGGSKMPVVYNDVHTFINWYNKRRLFGAYDECSTCPSTPPATGTNTETKLPSYVAHHGLHHLEIQITEVVLNAQTHKNPNPPQTITSQTQLTEDQKKNLPEALKESFETPGVVITGENEEALDTFITNISQFLKPEKLPKLTEDQMNDLPKALKDSVAASGVFITGENEAALEKFMTEISQTQTTEESQEYKFTKDQLNNIPEELKKELDVSQVSTLTCENRNAMDDFVHKYILPVLQPILTPLTHPNYRHTRKWKANNQKFMNYVALVFILKYSLQKYPVLCSLIFTEPKCEFHYPFKWWEVKEFQRKFVLQGYREDENSDYNPHTALPPEQHEKYFNSREELRKLYGMLTSRIVNCARFVQSGIIEDFKIDNPDFKEKSDKLRPIDCIREKDCKRPPEFNDIREFNYLLKKAIDLVEDESDTTPTTDDKHFCHPNEKALCMYVLKWNPSDEAPAYKKKRLSNKRKSKKIK